ncbi:MAG: hypothetical protein ABIQ36_12240, partial [Rhodanobacter sp.]
MIFALRLSTVDLVPPAAHTHSGITALLNYARRGGFVPACAFVRQEPRVSGKVMSKPPITVSRVDMERIE